MVGWALNAISGDRQVARPFAELRTKVGTTPIYIRYFFADNELMSCCLIVGPTCPILGDEGRTGSFAEALCNLRDALSAWFGSINLVYLCTYGGRLVLTGAPRRVYTHLYAEGIGGLHVVENRAARKRTQFNLNLPQAELARIKKLSDERRIPMVNIIRFALDRLFEQLEGGQLELPLGLDKREL